MSYPEGFIRFKKVIVSVDRNGLLWITEFRHPILNRFMEVLSRMGDGDVWTASLLVMLGVGGTPRVVAKKIVPRILGSLALCYALKRVARRTRPGVTVEGFSSLLHDPDPYSFPSSHAACSWAACVSAGRVIGGLGWLLPCYAVLVSYSRIHVGAHYPFDVLVGTSIGASIGGL